MKREKKNQKDATIRCLLLTSVSTRFGHHYAVETEVNNKHLIVASCWFFPLSSHFVYDARSQEPKARDISF